MTRTTTRAAGRSSTTTTSSGGAKGDGFVWSARREAPNCGKVSTVDEETLLDQTQELVCPYCNASFDIELEGTEDEQPEDNDQ